MRITRTRLIALSGMIPLGNASAQVDENAVQKAQLTLSAFECFAFTAETDQKEQERLFRLGYEAGKAFIELVAEKPPSDATRNKIAVLWGSTHGPTADFILGQIFSHMIETAYDDLGEDIDRWEFMKTIRYQEKNCGLLGR